MIRKNRLPWLLRGLLLPCNSPLGVETGRGFVVVPSLALLVALARHSDPLSLRLQENALKDGLKDPRLEDDSSDGEGGTSGVEMSSRKPALMCPVSGQLVRSITDGPLLAIQQACNVHFHTSISPFIHI
jgi:hypothetical protein